jgi:DNA invertase Pin-like site-specific DNA recombinase
MSVLLGYARVATGEQELALQHDALEAAGLLANLQRHRQRRAC